MQIKTDAVRSPEIQADAVRSPEIRADAVRSSEIRDESIGLADIAPGARTALDAPRVRLAEDSEADVPTCSGSLTDCPNLLSVVLPAENWLVQAKFTMRNNGNPGPWAPRAASSRAAPPSSIGADGVSGRALSNGQQRGR